MGTIVSILLIPIGAILVGYGDHVRPKPV